MTGHDKVFVDSNILIYLIDEISTNGKKEKTENLLSPEFIISTQVVSENVSVCLKKLKLGKKEVFKHARSLLTRFKVVTIHREILLKSFELSEKYQYGIWDSIILATALLYDCNTVYSEDMQDGQVIEDTLTIKNPFKF
ncbi:MAG: PIN domain-containing protein [Cyclobacteriaceae bacterium]|nr:PIN domain-containing protein [Cyclobacteriaceae bacterium]